MMSKYSHKRTGNRRGVSTVEFAVVAPIFFLTMFACFEFGRVSMIESFVEDAAFKAARHVIVIGASVNDGTKVAEDSLAIFGIQNATITIDSEVDGVAQTKIDDMTDTVSVTVSVPMEDNMLISRFVNGAVIERTAVLRTERYRTLN